MDATSLDITRMIVQSLIKIHFKKKYMIVAWDDLDEVPERGEQEANVCLMTNLESKEKCF
jgi:hypothetical protein